MCDTKSRGEMMGIYRRLMKLTSPDGDLDVPGDRLRMEFGPDDDGYPMNVVVTNEGGSSMWIAYNHGAWQFHTDTRYAYQLARWIIWDWWVKGTWCGIRRRVYFWALHREVKTWIPATPTTPRPPAQEVEA